MSRSRLLAILLPLVLVACVPGEGDDDDSAAGAPDDDDAAIDPAAICDELGLPRLAFHEGPYGSLRHQVADDFTVRTKLGADWNFRAEFSGCESYIFLLDTLTVSPLDPTPLFEKTDDLAELVRRSPPNVHYFFISAADSGDAENAVTDALRERLDGLLADWPDDIDESADHWAARLHVVNDRRSRLDNWLEDALGTHGRRGLAIDRHQTVRGVGSLADVLRRNAELEAAEMWPWEDNIAYAAHEAVYYNYEAERQARLDAETDVTIVTAWQDEILQEFAETDVVLPDAATMATFDTLEFDLTAWCPNEFLLEQSNCGAWDYLAHIYVQEEDESWTELARFITTYHRAGRYVVDATPALVHLRDGGTRRIRYNFAPPWNVQPTLTRLDFRFSNRGKGVRPTASTFLYAGGGFNASYNEGRDPVEVEIPATASRVELWALITGHGAATGQCAEFCDHQHEFTIDGTPFLREHPAIGNPLGCAETISTGTVPNQSGTWWTGRGGWCPGRQVDPWVVDVTDTVSAGATTTVTYRGLWNGNPPPADGGNIQMTSWLVVYE